MPRAESRQRWRTTPRPGPRHARTPGGRDARRPAQDSSMVQAVRFLRAPTIAVSTAPATPPPATWPTMLPISGVEAELASSGISMPRICPPAPPPIAPAMVFPSVPKSMFLAAPAATLPPTAPLMTWMIRLMSNPDMTLFSADPVCSVPVRFGAPDLRPVLQPKRLDRKGHAAAAKDSDELWAYPLRRWPRSVG